jgi:hypothetical protein
VSKFKKRHPSLKHGAYSSTAILPGENPAEFEELYQALIAELAPTGALEEDIVANIARLVWRKRNLATLLGAEDDFRLDEIGNIATAERLLSDLEMEGRLDALIDKCLKRLLFVRGLKSLPAASAPPRPTQQPPALPGPSKAT